MRTDYTSHYGPVGADESRTRRLFLRELPPQRGPGFGFGFGHVVPQGMVQAPAVCRSCKVKHVNDTTGLLGDRCTLCGGSLDHCD